MKLNCSKFEFVFFVFGSAFIVSFFFCLLYSMAVHGNLLRNSDYSSHVIHDQDRFSKRSPLINNPHPLSEFEKEPSWNSSSKVKVMTEDSGIRNKILDKFGKWNLVDDILLKKVDPCYLNLLIFQI